MKKNCADCNYLEIKAYLKTGILHGGVINIYPDQAKAILKLIEGDYRHKDRCKGHFAIADYTQKKKGRVSPPR